MVSYSGLVGSYFVAPRKHARYNLVKSIIVVIVRRVTVGVIIDIVGVIVGIVVNVIVDIVGSEPGSLFLIILPAFFNC